MADVKLRAKRPTMTVDVGGEREVEVPLTFTRAEFEAFGKAEDRETVLFDFFRTYLGDVVDEIGDDDLGALVSAWNDARKRISEPQLGESSASQQ